jgi:hypothetical protein
MFCDALSAVSEVFGDVLIAFTFLGKVLSLFVTPQMVIGVVGLSPATTVVVVGLLLQGLLQSEMGRDQR